jgi:hypothetical protein
MSSIWEQALAALPEVAERPLALVGLVVLIVSAALLHWKKAQLKSLERTTSVLPEPDRLRAIRLHYGTQPQTGISAESWLSSRRQLFVFWAYVSTLMCAVPLASVVWGTVDARPGGKHWRELRADYATLDAKLASYELCAQNLRDGFERAGARALDPDPQLDAELTRLMLAYNDAYDDLQAHRAQYVEVVVRWLSEQPDWARRVDQVVSYALNEVHQSGILGFNLFYEKALEARNARRQHGAAAGEGNSPLVDRAADREVTTRTRDIKHLLDSFRYQRLELTKGLLRNG